MRRHVGETYGHAGRATHESGGTVHDTRMAQEEGVVVLDVRTADGLSVRPYQIFGTRWLPLAEVVQQADTLPRPRTIVTYCT